MSDDGGIGKHDDKLHARIRELEWECARLAQLANEATARAAKAEARVAELERLNDELRRPVICEREAD